MRDSEFTRRPRELPCRSKERLILEHFSDLNSHCIRKKWLLQEMNTSRVFAYLPHFISLIMDFLFFLFLRLWFFFFFFFFYIKFFAFVLVGHPKIKFLSFMHLCFKTFLWEPTLYTVEPRYSKPLYCKVLGITNDFLHPRNSKKYGKEPGYNQT